MAKKLNDVAEISKDVAGAPTTEPRLEARRQRAAATANPAAGDDESASDEKRIYSRQRVGGGADLRDSKRARRELGRSGRGGKWGTVPCLSSPLPTTAGGPKFKTLRWGRINYGKKLCLDAGPGRERKLPSDGDRAAPRTDLAIP